MASARRDCLRHEKSRGPKPLPFPLHNCLREFPPRSWRSTTEDLPFGPPTACRRGSGKVPWARPTISASHRSPAGNGSAAALPGASEPRRCRRAQPQDELPTVAVSALASVCACLPRQVYRPGRADPGPYRRWVGARRKAQGSGQSGVFACILPAWPWTHSIPDFSQAGRLTFEITAFSMIAALSLAELAVCTQNRVLCTCFVVDLERRKIEWRLAETGHTSTSDWIR